MSDARLRLLERAALATGSPRDHAAVLHERLRVGSITADMLVLAAFALDPGARLVVLGRTEDELRYPVGEDASAYSYPLVGDGLETIEVYGGANAVNLHAVRDSPSADVTAWATWLAKHPTPYVAKIAAVAVAMRVQSHVEANHVKTCQYPADLAHQCELLSTSGDAIQAMRAWLQCPCPLHRSDLAELIETVGRGDPNNWWKMAGALICGYAPAGEAMSQVVTCARRALMPLTDRITGRKLKASAEKIAYHDAGCVVRTAMADVLRPWALRGAEIPAPVTL